MPDTLPIAPTMTINEIVAHHPEAIPVFNRFGLDLCCGSSVSLEAAVHRDGLDLTTVLTALRDAMESP